MTKMKVTVTQTINKVPYGGKKSAVFDLDMLKTDIKLNKTTGFVGLHYRKKLKTNSKYMENSNYNRPALKSLPGTWCANCPARDGSLHDSACPAPEVSELLLTTQGMVSLLGDSKALGKNGDLQGIGQKYRAGTVSKGALEDEWLGSIVNTSKGCKPVSGKYKTNFNYLRFKVKPGPSAVTQARDSVTGEVYARPRDSKTSEELSFKNALTLSYKGISKSSGSKNIGVRLYPSGSVEVFSAPLDMLEKLYSDLRKALRNDFKMDPNASPISSIKMELLLLDGVTLDVNNPEVRKEIEKSIPEAELQYGKGRTGTLQFSILDKNVKLAVQLHRGGVLQVDVSKVKSTDLQTKEHHDYSIDVERYKGYVARLAEKLRKSVAGVIAPAEEKNSKGLLTTITGTWPNGPCRASRQVKGKPGMKEMQRPSPYSFRGKCPEPNQYLIPQGKNGRGKVFYPCCGMRTATAEQKYREQLLNGFPGKGDDAIGDPDMKSGVIPPEYFVVGANVMVKRPKETKDRSRSPTIRTSGWMAGPNNGPPSNSQYVKATMVEIRPKAKKFVVNIAGELHTITRKDLQPETRKFEGFFARFKNAPSGIKDDTSDLIKIIKRIRPTQAVLNSKFPKPSVGISYLTIDDVPRLAQATGVAATADKTAVPVQFSVDQTSLYVIHHGVAVHTAALTTPAKKQSGVGFFNASSKSLELVDASYKSSDTRIESIQMVPGNVMNLMSRKGVSQWLIGLGDRVLAYQETPRIHLSLTILRKHKPKGAQTATHRIVGYKNVTWKEDEPIRYIAKGKIGKTYMMEINFNKDTGALSESRPLDILEEVEPIFPEETIDNGVTYAVEYPIFKRKNVAGQLYWEVNNNIIDSSFKKKQFKKK